MGILSAAQLALTRSYGNRAFDTTVTRTKDSGTPTRTALGGYVPSAGVASTTFDAKILKRDRIPVEGLTGTTAITSSNEYEILLPAGSHVLPGETLVHSSGTYLVRGNDEGKSDEVYRVVICTKEE